MSLTVTNAADQLESMFGDALLDGDMGNDDIIPEDQATKGRDDDIEEVDVDETTDSGDEDDDGSEDTDSEVQDSEEDEALESEEDDGSDSEFEEMEVSQDEIASMLGLPEDGVQVGNDGVLKLKTNINGDVEYKSLADIVKGYQTDGALSQKGHKQAQEYKERAAELEDAENHVRSAWNQAQAVINSSLTNIQDEYNKVNWESLRDSDPAEYAALDRDFNNRYQAAQHQAANIKTNIDSLATEDKGKTDHAHNEYVRDQQAVMLDLIPEWQKSAVATKEMGEVSKFLGTMGFTEGEVSEIYDARIVALANKARKYDDLKKNVSTTKRRVSKAPKMVSGKKGKQGAPQVKNQQRQNLDKSRKSGTVKDAALAMEGFI